MRAGIDVYTMDVECRGAITANSARFAGSTILERRETIVEASAVGIISHVCPARRSAVRYVSTRALGIPLMPLSSRLEIHTHIRAL